MAKSAIAGINKRVTSEKRATAKLEKQKDTLLKKAEANKTLEKAKAEKEKLKKDIEKLKKK